MDFIDRYMDFTDALVEGKRCYVTHVFIRKDLLVLFYRPVISPMDSAGDS
jgi:hypothetical protein